MATLQSTTVSGNVSSPAILDSQADMSEWYKLSHCVCDGSSYSDCLGTGYQYLHVRTPWPVNTSAGMGWNPYILEVVGYHTYSGECWHDWLAVVNTNGYTETGFYGSNIKINRSTTASSPYVYMSANTYGGYNRVCFSMRKVSCCCTGYFWVRARQNGIAYRTQYAWATFHNNSQTAQVF